ncbi:MAG TPA: SRPBCC family protein [Thermoanaerobaculia bacterium]
MTTATDPTTDVPVRRSVRVKASPERAFRVFTEEFDGWWPRTHHIGKSPMKRAILEGAAGGRCYTEQEDGTECDWGRVRVWDPPRRLVLAWQITHQWGFEPDIAKASEVEIRFVPDGDGFTRVELEHRNFPKHGEGWESMRKAVDSEGGWGTLLDLYAKHAAAA